MDPLVVVVDLLIQHLPHFDLALDARDQHLVLHDAAEEQIPSGEARRHRQYDPEIVRDHDLRCQEKLQTSMQHKEQYDRQLLADGQFEFIFALVLRAGDGILREGLQGISCYSSPYGNVLLQEAEELGDDAKDAADENGAYQGVTGLDLVVEGEQVEAGRHGIGLQEELSNHCRTFGLLGCFCAVRCRSIRSVSGRTLWPMVLWIVAVLWLSRNFPLTRLRLDRRLAADGSSIG